MTADGRKHEAFDLLLLGEWAFSLERLSGGFCLHCWESFPKRIPKVSFGEPLLNAAS